jgi:hypothetical protein
MHVVVDVARVISFFQDVQIRSNLQPGARCVVRLPRDNAEYAADRCASICSPRRKANGHRTNWRCDFAQGLVLGKQIEIGPSAGKLLIGPNGPKTERLDVSR